MYEEKNMVETSIEENAVAETYVETEASGVKTFIKIGVAAAAAIVGGGIAVFKNRGKLAAKHDQKEIKRLEKKGYVVTKPDIIEEVEEDISKDMDSDK